MSKTLIIQQYFGIGDIIFTQKIANDFIAEGYKILWPVKPEWVSGLRRAYPRIEFIDYQMIPVNYENKKFYEKDGFTYLPMRYSESILGLPYRFHMESKYSYLGKDWKGWKEFAYPVRDHHKEMSLLYELGIAKDDKFNFISTVFGSDANHKINVNVNNDYKNVEMRFVPGYSLFDWCRVIERAETIHAVSSSTLYLFELLDLSAKEIHLYCRKPIEQNFDYVSFLFTKPYILHD